MSPHSEKIIIRVLFIVLALGTFYRLYPVFSGQPMLSQFFITEDGYLMLTIARNMAIGLGMSVSDGTIASNGVQPLATFLFSIPYLLTGGDKTTSLVGIHLIVTVISVLGVFSVRALARMVLAPLGVSLLWPWIIATLWYVSPLLLLHTMNGLETGLYTVTLTTTLVLFGRLLSKGTSATFADRMILGAACGLTFLARNDAVFAITALFVVWALHELLVRKGAFWVVAGRLIPPGIMSLVIAAPWLINNYINFGSIVPVSGTAQALSGGLAKNAAILPAKLFEHMFPMLPVPSMTETHPIFMIFAVALVVGVHLLLLLYIWRQDSTVRAVVATYVAAAVVMSAYYGFYFGAGWFLSRYLAPLAPLFMIAIVFVLLRLSGRYLVVLMPAALAGVALSVALLGWMLVPGVRDQGHFQVVDWLTDNVSDDVWVGAVQTGTIGYWHDRTLNLDGKVNPEALQVLLRDGHIANYVVSSDADVLADWHGLVGWVGSENAQGALVGAHFEVVVDDPAQNLGVLQRR